MRALVSSPRWRRRFLWLGVPTVLAAGVIGVSLKLGNTAETVDLKPRQNDPAVITREPKRVPATKREKHDAHETAVRFINTAVRRKNVAASWELVTPNLRSGYTRRAWSSGNIPVVTFPAKEPRLAPWRVDYEHRNALGLVFLLLPEEERRDFAPTTFFLDLKAVGKGKNRRWLVDYFLPAGTSGAPSAAGEGSGSGFPNLGATAAQGERSRLGREWMAIPLALLGLIVAVPVAFAFRGWYTGRRAQRAYERRL